MNSKANSKMYLMIVLAFLISVRGNADADLIFGEPTNLGSPVNTSYRDGLACTSSDGLSLFFASQRSGGYGGWDLWISTRATTEDPWQEPVNLGPKVNSPDPGRPGTTAVGPRLVSPPCGVLPPFAWCPRYPHTPPKFGCPTRARRSLPMNDSIADLNAALEGRYRVERELGHFIRGRTESVAEATGEFRSFGVRR